MNLFDKRRCFFIEQFIVIYRQHRMLWDAEFNKRSSQLQIDEALLRLKQKLCRLLHEASNDTVITILNYLRTTYLQELKKVKDSLKSGAKGEQVYKPDWWCFPLLSFLASQETDVRNGEVNAIKFGSGTSLDAQPDSSGSESERMDLTSVLPESLARILMINYKEHVKHSNQKSDTKIESSVSDEEIDKITGNIGIKLRRFPSEQRIMAERLINDVLYHGEMGDLKRDSKLLV